MQRLTEAQPAHVTAIPETGDEHASSVNNNASQFIDAYSEATEPYPVSFAEGANDDDRDARHGHEMPPLDPADFDEEMVG